MGNGNGNVNGQSQGEHLQEKANNIKNKNTKTRNDNYIVSILI